MAPPLPSGYLFTNDPDYLTQHGSMEPMYKNQQPPKPAPPVEEEKKEPGMMEKGFEKVKDGSKRAYQTVSSTVGSMLKKNEAQERRQARYSSSFGRLVVFWKHVFPSRRVEDIPNQGANMYKLTRISHDKPKLSKTPLIPAISAFRIDHWPRWSLRRGDSKAVGFLLWGHRAKHPGLGP